MKHKAKTWREVYTGLRRCGLTNKEIADVLGCGVVVVSNVINGTYKYRHEPPYSGGIAALVALKRKSAEKGLELELVKGQGAPLVKPYVPRPGLVPYDPK